MLDLFAIVKIGAVSTEFIALFSNLGDAKEWISSLTHKEWRERRWEIRNVQMDAPHYIGEQDWAA